MNSGLTTREIAKDLKISIKTVQKYIQIGFLPAKLTWTKAGKKNTVDFNDYYEWKTTHFKNISRGSINLYNRKDKPLKKEELLELIPEWLD